MRHLSAPFIDSVLLLRCNGDQGNPLKHLAPCVRGSDLFVGLFSTARVLIRVIFSMGFTINVVVSLG